MAGATSVGRAKRRRARHLHPAPVRQFAFPVLALLLAGRAAADDPPQIEWQRSLNDAVAMAQAEDRPLFIAINMDGESASERIVREEYRDPKFVAATRPFVCVVASVFRHSERDCDERGRRIPCPRLGVVTCGEHIALEPELFDKYLSDGDRVAPRHAVVLQDGKKAWDLSLIFDLKDLDAALEQSARTELDRRAAAHPPAPSSPELVDPRERWLALAARRDQRGRSEFEEALAAAAGATEVTDAIAALEARGDGGSIGALHIASLRLAREWNSSDRRPALAAKALHLETQLAEALKSDLRSLGRLPGSLDPDGDAGLLPLLAEVGGGEPGIRSTLLACHSTGNYGKESAAAIERAFGGDEAARVERCLEELGGPGPPQEALAAATEITRGAANGSLPTPGPVTDAMPDEETLQKNLSELLELLGSHAGDPKIGARYAKCALDLGRTKIDASPQDARLLLEDAEIWYGKALAHDPGVFEWWVERARAAYFRDRFRDEETFGRRALATALGVEDAVVPRARDAAAILADGRAIEALRWIGDADARLLGDRSGKDAAAEFRGIVEGARALGIVAASPFADGNDWLGFASFYGALGLRREKLAILEQAAQRLPAAPEIWDALNGVLWSAGRIDLAPVTADGIASSHPACADALWFAGRAWIFAAEDLRRREQPDASIAAYAQADERFARVIAMRPDFADHSKWWIGASWLGRGFAHLLADRRADAADCLARAVSVTPAIGTAKDGLDREVVDLVDQCLEWRASGPSPVDALALLDRLEAADPSNPSWAIAVSDAELREALRSDGRNPERVERETVDAAGRKIRMPMGLPTLEGDGQLRLSIAAARRALKHGDSEENRLPLAQSATIWGERMLERNRPDEARDELSEAAQLMGIGLPAADADAAAIRELATRLRGMLGDARPRYRPGR